MLYKVFYNLLFHIYLTKWFLNFKHIAVFLNIAVYKFMVFLNSIPSYEYRILNVSIT